MQRRIGSSNIQNISEMLESHAIWPFTNAGPQSWTLQNIQDCNGWARHEIQNASLKPYVVLYVATPTFLHDTNLGVDTWLGASGNPVQHLKAGVACRCHVVDVRMLLAASSVLGVCGQSKVRIAGMDERRLVARVK
jgi:hypothetical protein